MAGVKTGFRLHALHSTPLKGRMGLSEVLSRAAEVPLEPAAPGLRCQGAQGTHQPLHTALLATSVACSQLRRPGTGAAPPRHIARPVCFCKVQVEGLAAGAAATESLYVCFRSHKQAADALETLQSQGARMAGAFTARPTALSRSKP